MVLAVATPLVVGGSEMLVGAERKVMGVVERKVVCYSLVDY